MNKFTAKQIEYLQENVEMDDLRIHQVCCDVLGDVRGDVRGCIFGDVEGNVLGDVQGNVIGDVFGSIWGDVGRSVLGDVAGCVRGDIDVGKEDAAHCIIGGIDFDMTHDLIAEDKIEDEIF